MLSPSLVLGDLELESTPASIANSDTAPLSSPESLYRQAASSPATSATQVIAEHPRFTPPFVNRSNAIAKKIIFAKPAQACSKRPHDATFAKPVRDHAGWPDIPLSKPYQAHPLHPTRRLRSHQNDHLGSCQSARKSPPLSKALRLPPSTQPVRQMSIPASRFTICPPSKFSLPFILATAFRLWFCSRQLRASTLHFPHLVFGSRRDPFHPRARALE